MPLTLTRYRKFLTALLGAAAQFPIETLPADWQPKAHTALGILTALAVCVVKNEDYPVADEDVYVPAHAAE